MENHYADFNNFVSYSVTDLRYLFVGLALLALMICMYSITMSAYKISSLGDTTVGDIIKFFFRTIVMLCICIMIFTTL